MRRSEGSRSDPQGLWAGFTLPGTVWLIALFLVPFYAIAAIAFGGIDPLFGSAVPRWNPVTWNFDAANDPAPLV